MSLWAKITQEDLEHQNRSLTGNILKDALMLFEKNSGLSILYINEFCTIEK